MHHDPQRVPQSPREITPPLLGTTIPELQVRSTKNEETDLASVLRKKPTVLVFYRGGW